MAKLDIFSVNFSIEITCFLFSMVLLLSLFITSSYKNKLTHIIMWMLLTSCITLLTDAIAWIFAGQPGMRTVLILVNFLSYLSSYMQMVLVSNYIISYLCLRRIRVSRGFVSFSVVIPVIMVILIIISQFNGIVYYLDDKNRFAAGPLYTVSLCLSVAYLVILMVLVLHYRKKLTKRDMNILFLFLLTLLTAFILEIFVLEIMMVYTATSLILITLYVGVQVQMEVHAAKTESEQKSAIMLSQIQPHFLYNTLNSIDNLFYIDPEKGHEALYTFSDYLRGNMDSLAKKDLIHFTQELEHTRQYLKLECLRFKTRLVVNYEITAEDFLIPVLTLQPIVENAVRYGVTKKREGGMIIIRTEETKLCYRITVCDNGVGFEPDAPQQEDGRSHIGIDNVRQRLSAMCGGTLTILSSPGKGAAAIIEIPK